jgi:2-C-methyl-D-erythritol 2,4-cyclodiphosphate synthase
MRNRLSELLQIDLDKISIKAKTNEELDAVGRGEAIVSQAIVLVKKEILHFTSTQSG